METLVIHPLDSTTSFLNKIYKEKGWTVVKDGQISKGKLRKLINEHDRIVMLGHGSPEGMGDFIIGRYLIDASMVQFLRGKELVGIWCYAKQFFYKYNLKGFCSDMFISDYMEANMNCVNSGTSEIDASNNHFSEVLGKHIFKQDVLKLVKDEYSIINHVTEFNNNSLFYIN